MSGPAWWVLAGSVFHHFSDTILHWFSDAFWHGFGLEFGEILDICASFWHQLFDRRICMDFHWISMDFWDPETMENLNFTWYSGKKRKKSHIPILHWFCTSIWSHVGMVFGTLFHDVQYFFGVVYWMSFGMPSFRFIVEMVAKWLPKSMRGFNFWRLGAPKNPPKTYPRHNLVFS